MALRTRANALGLALAAAVLGAPPASACDWWLLCDGWAQVGPPEPRSWGYRSAPRWHGNGYRQRYGYRAPPRRYGYYGAPAWAYGDPYAAWPSTAIPPTPWYLDTALPGANTPAIGLTAPVSSADGLLKGGLPARGPSLFGPDPVPAGNAWGYYYNAPPNGYYSAPSYWSPPSETPSWWLEPRRRRR